MDFNFRGNDNRFVRIGDVTTFQARVPNQAAMRIEEIAETREEDESLTAGELLLRGFQVFEDKGPNEQEMQSLSREPDEAENCLMAVRLTESDYERFENLVKNNGYILAAVGGCFVMRGLQVFEREEELKT